MTCPYCDIALSEHGRCGRFCSQRCYIRHRKQQARWFQCADCGETFDVLTRGASKANAQDERYCSRTCWHRAAKRRYKHRKRANGYEPISMAKVAQRDGWRCHICKRKVTQATWSLDHLVPVSYGGSHTYDNVALAHQHCNALRGNHGSAQLRFAA